MGWKQNSCTSSVFLRLLKSRNGLCRVKGMSKIQSNDLITYMGLTNGKMETCEVKIKFFQKNLLVLLFVCNWRFLVY